MVTPARTVLLTLFLATGFAATGSAMPQHAHAEGLKSCVTFGVTAAEPLGVLHFSTDYSGVQGSFDGSGDTVACRSLIEGASITANDQCDGDYSRCQWGDGRKLNLALVHPAGFSSTRAAVRCRFVSAEEVDGGSFAVELLGAGRPKTLESLPEQPEVSVAAGACP
jgi:hypothetical protein